MDESHPRRTGSTGDDVGHAGDAAGRRMWAWVVRQRVWLEVPQGVRSGAALGNGSGFRIGAAVELNEVVHRIVVRHWAIIVVCLLLGLGASLGLSKPAKCAPSPRPHGSPWTTPPPKSSAEAIATSDTARAIVTTHNQVRAALEAAHARRDVGGFARAAFRFGRSGAQASSR